MRGPAYGQDFWLGEVERLSLLLTQSLTPEDRVSYQTQLASAREHLAEFETKPTT